MKASHSHLDVTDADWRVFLDDTVNVMTTLRIPTPEQSDLPRAPRSFSWGNREPGSGIGFPARAALITGRHRRSRNRNLLIWLPNK